MRFWDGSAWLAPSGWYTDTADGSPAFWGDRWWDGDRWYSTFRRRWWARGHGVPSPNPKVAIANTALGLSVCSLAVPALALFAIGPPAHGPASDWMTLMACIGLACWILAVIGFRSGIVTRHDLRGAIAVCVSRAGGVVSVATLFLAFTAVLPGDLT